MEAVIDPVTYKMIGTVDKANGGGWFANCIDEESLEECAPEGFFKQKRSAIAYVKRNWKAYKKENVKN